MQHLLSSVSIRNFRIFRGETHFKLGVGSYLIGTNNSGKSTVLLAIRHFFDDTLYETKDFLNRTEASSRKQNSNVSHISIEFNLLAITKRVMRETLIKEYGDTLTVAKSVTLTDLGVIKILYRLGDQTSAKSFNDLPDQVKQLINSVKINYLHPQQGAQLLYDAQQKLKRRLLDNWGRTGSVTQGVRKLEEQWSKFRDTARVYLSEGLNANLNRMWPESEIRVSLPEDIKEILAVSEISYSSYKGAPSISLLNQGSGAQSLILYFTHYMLDVDRTMHRASEYHPVWLVEEPESFMHSDLISKLADEFNAPEWSEKIQLVVSTHSPIILSRSRKIGKDSQWHQISIDKGVISRPSNEWSMKDIKGIGRMLGDENFLAYLLSSSDSKPIVIEDSRNATIEVYRRAGINVQGGMGSVSKVRQAISALVPIANTLTTKTIFIVDNDKGLKELEEEIRRSKLQKELNGYKIYDVGSTNSLFLLLTPQDTAAEDMIVEYGDYVKDSLEAVFDVAKRELKTGYANYLSGVVASLYQTKSENLNEDLVLKKIKSDSHVKQEFWNRVEQSEYTLNYSDSDTIKKLIDTV